MAKEIEHKYLVVTDEYMNMAIKYHRIRQGYLSRNPERVVRVRIVDDTAFLTIKGKNAGDTREEFEYEIPADDAVKILSMCEERIIEKTRYIIEYAGHIWEVDQFEGNLAPLVVAEIELPSSNHDYPLPPFVGQEVTGNPDYYNSNLS